MKDASAAADIHGHGRCSERKAFGDRHGPKRRASGGARDVPLSRGMPGGASNYGRVDYGRRRVPRINGATWPPTRMTFGLPSSVSTLTSIRLAWWISMPCSTMNVGAGSFPDAARDAPQAAAALSVAGSSLPRSGATPPARTAASGATAFSANALHATV